MMIICNSYQWEETLIYGDKPHYTYPEQDLLWNLVSLYFKHTNMFLPLLHRPTFEKSLAAGQHMWDPSFGMTVLLVCANASRYSDDPRVILAGDPYGLSCGWKYFCQVPVYRNTLLASFSVYDLQYYCVSSIHILFYCQSKPLFIACNHLSPRNIDPRCWLESSRFRRPTCY